jgi:hypothetical protein
MRKKMNEKNVSVLYDPIIRMAYNVSLKDLR